MKFVCTSCGSVYRIENTGGVEPPLNPVLKAEEPCPCPPPHTCEPDWQRAFCEADTARSKLEGELEREREISDRFQKENNTLTMKCTALEETLEKEIEEVKLLKQNYDRLYENVRMQLAAISTAANQNTETTIKDRIDGSSPYWTVAYQDVCAAVDREMRHRRRANELEEINRKIRRYLGGFGDCEQENVKHPTPRK